MIVNIDKNLIITECIFKSMASLPLDSSSPPSDDDWEVEVVIPVGPAAEAVPDVGNVSKVLQDSVVPLIVGRVKKKPPVRGSGAGAGAGAGKKLDKNPHLSCDSPVGSSPKSKVKDPLNDDNGFNVSQLKVQLTDTGLQQQPLVTIVLKQLGVPINSRVSLSSHCDVILMPTSTIPSLAKLLSMRNLVHDPRFSLTVLNKLFDFIFKNSLRNDMFSGCGVETFAFSEPTLPVTCVKLFKSKEDLLAFLNVVNWFHATFNLDLFDQAYKQTKIGQLTEISMIALLIDSTNFCTLTLSRVIKNESDNPGSYFRNILFQMIKDLKERKLGLDSVTLLTEMNHFVGLITITGESIRKDDFFMNCPATLKDFMKMLRVLAYAHVIQFLSTSLTTGDSSNANRIMLTAFQLVCVTFGLNDFPPACCFSTMSPLATKWLSDLPFIETVMKNFSCVSDGFLSKPNKLACLSQNPSLFEYMEKIPPLVRTSSEGSSKGSSIFPGYTGSGKTTVLSIVSALMSMMKNSTVILIVPPVTLDYVQDLLRALHAIVSNISDEATKDLPLEFQFLRNKFPSVYLADNSCFSLLSLSFKGGIVLGTNLSVIPPILATVKKEIQAGTEPSIIHIIIDDPSTGPVSNEFVTFDDLMRIIDNYSKLFQINFDLTVLSATVRHTSLIDSDLAQKIVPLPFSRFQPEGSNGLLSVRQVCQIFDVFDAKLKTGKIVPTEEQLRNFESLKLVFLKLGPFPNIKDIKDASTLVRDLCKLIKDSHTLASMNMLPFDGSPVDRMLLIMSKINESSNESSKTTIVLGLDDQRQFNDLIKRIETKRLLDSSSSHKKVASTCKHGMQLELCKACNNEDKKSSSSSTSSSTAGSSKPAVVPRGDDDEGNMKFKPSRSKTHSNSSARTTVVDIIDRISVPINTKTTELLGKIAFELEGMVSSRDIKILLMCLAMGVYPGLMIEQLKIGIFVLSYINMLISNGHINVILLANSSDPILGLNLPGIVTVIIMDNASLKECDIMQTTGRTQRRQTSRINLPCIPTVFDLRRSHSSACQLSSSDCLVRLPYIRPLCDTMHRRGDVIPPPFFDSAILHLLTSTFNLPWIYPSLLKNIMLICDSFQFFFSNRDNMTTQWSVAGPEFWGISSLMSNLLLLKSAPFKMPYTKDKTGGTEMPSLFSSSRLEASKFVAVIRDPVNQKNHFDEFRKLMCGICRNSVGSPNFVTSILLFESNGIIITDRDGVTISQVEVLLEIIRFLLQLLTLIIRTYTVRSIRYCILSEMRDMLRHYRERLSVRHLATIEFEEKSRPLHHVDAYIIENPKDADVIELGDMEKRLARAKRALYLSVAPLEHQSLSDAVSEIERDITERRLRIEHTLLSRKYASLVTSAFCEFSSAVLDLAKPVLGLCNLQMKTAREKLKVIKDIFMLSLEQIPLDPEMRDHFTKLVSVITRDGGRRLTGKMDHVEFIAMLGKQIECLEHVCNPTFSIVTEGDVLIKASVRTPLNEIHQIAGEFEACFYEVEAPGDNDPEATEAIQALRDRISALLGKK